AVLWFVATVSIGPCRPVPPSFPTRRSSDLQIFVGSHDGHAAHRNVFSQVLATLGEHDSERLGGDDSILEEQFIEVAHPVPEQAVRVGSLDLQILRDGGRGFCRGTASAIRGNGWRGLILRWI